MRYIWQHIQAITETYNGSLPLAHFLKNYFRQYPKLGSRDRKILSDMSYCFYRCNKAIPVDVSDFTERIKTALFLCSQPVKHLQLFLEQYPVESLQGSLQEKLNYLSAKNIIIKIQDLLPGAPAVSQGITKETWLYATLQQPRFFIRIRREKMKLLALLTQHGISYTEITSTCISLPNATGIDQLIPQDWYVVQDASSQRTGDHFKTAAGEKWWDCCSGAGGKSLLLKDKEPHIALTVSDVRESILHNLKMRFKQYGYPAPASFVLDAAQNSQLYAQLDNRQFDHILCDVPCTGSGTWARTPEQLYFFEAATVEDYAQRQKNISTNVINYLKPGGRLYYITCSVFAAENEAVVSTLLETEKLELEESVLINGIGEQADCMFIAVLRKK